MDVSNGIDDQNLEESSISDNNVPKPDHESVSSLLKRFAVDCTSCPNGENRIPDPRLEANHGNKEDVESNNYIITDIINNVSNDIINDVMRDVSNVVNNDVIPDAAQEEDCDCDEDDTIPRILVLKQQNEIQISLTDHEKLAFRCAAAEAHDMNTDISTMSDENVCSLVNLVAESTCECGAVDCDDDEILEVETIQSFLDEEEDFYEDEEEEDIVELDWDYGHRSTKPQRTACHQNVSGMLLVDNGTTSIKNERPRTTKKERRSLSKNKRSQTPTRELPPSLRKERLRSRTKGRSRTLKRERTRASKQEILWTPEKERPLSPPSYIKFSNAEEDGEFSYSSTLLQKRLEKIYEREQKIREMEMKLGKSKKKKNRTCSTDTASETDFSDALSSKTGLKVLRVEL